MCRSIVKEQVGFKELSEWALANPDPAASGLPSGRQELYEMLLNQCIR